MAHVKYLVLANYLAIVHAWLKIRVASCYNLATLTLLF